MRIAHLLVVVKGGQLQRLGWLPPRAQTVWTPERGRGRSLPTCLNLLTLWVKPLEQVCFPVQQRA